MAPLDLDKYVEIARQCKYLPENDLKDLKIVLAGAGEMSQWLRVLTALPEDLEGSSIPSKDLMFVTFCNSSSKGSDVLFWPL